jgi:hypothetical protein
MRAPSYTMPSMAWRSDIIEAILMRPCEPRHSRRFYTHRGFMEWDVLLLMLEWRNFLSRPGIPLISTPVVDYDLLY